MTYDNFSTHIPPECYEWLWIIEELQNIFIHWKDLKVPFTKAPRLLPAPAAGQQTSSRQPHSWRWPSPHKSPKDTKSRMNGRHQRLQQEQYSLAIRRTTIFKKTAAAKIIMTMTPATTRTTIATLKTTKKQQEQRQRQRLAADSTCLALQVDLWSQAAEMENRFFVSRNDDIQWHGDMIWRDAFSLPWISLSWIEFFHKFTANSSQNSNHKSQFPYMLRCDTKGSGNESALPPVLQRLTPRPGRHIHNRINSISC